MSSGSPLTKKQKAEMVEERATGKLKVVKSKSL